MNNSTEHAANKKIFWIERESFMDLMGSEWGVCLPKDARVLTVNHNIQMDTIEFLVESESFEPVSIGTPLKREMILLYPGIKVYCV